MSNTTLAASALSAFMRATNGDLPEPRTATIRAGHLAVDLWFKSLSDLLEWAQLLGAQVTGGDRLTHLGTYHHTMIGTWPAHDGTPVEFESTFIVDPAPAPARECSSEMELA